MNILLVEDNYEKFRNLYEITKHLEDKINIKKVISVNEAMNELQIKTYDLMIIDIQIPDINGGDINPEGGIELLENIENITDGWIPRYILGLTAHSDNFDKIKSSFNKYGWNVYQETNEKKIWNDIVLTKINTTIANKNYYNADIVLVTALEKPELDAVINNLPNKEIIYINSFEYYLCEFQLDNGKKIKIISASAEKMGSSWSSTLVTRMIMQFSPKLVIMTGICAGVEGKTSLGDIIIADPVWDWGAGKIAEANSERVFLPDPHQIPLAKSVKDRIRLISRNDQFLKKLALEWEKTPITNTPNILIGPMACGSSVISNQAMVNEINSNNRKMISIEMESYGVMSACSSFNTLGIIIKSVCDYGNKMKADEAQEYAAYTSARTAIEFIKTQFQNM